MEHEENINEDSKKLGSFIRVNINEGLIEISSDENLKEVRRTYLKIRRDLFKYKNKPYADYLG